jgi:hypothetical protein
VTWVKVDDSDSYDGYVRHVQWINLDQVVAIEESAVPEPGGAHGPLNVEIWTTAPHSAYIDKLPPGDRVQPCPHVICFIGEAAESFLRQIENL